MQDSLERCQRGSWKTSQHSVAIVQTRQDECCNYDNRKVRVSVSTVLGLSTGGGGLFQDMAKPPTYRHLLAEVASSLDARSSVCCISGQIYWLTDRLNSIRSMGSCYLMPVTSATPASYIKGTADVVAGIYWCKACKREAWGRVYVWKQVHCRHYSSITRVVRILHQKHEKFCVPFLCILH